MLWCFDLCYTGQIEVFNWSASGSLILESLSVSFPTVVVYLLDTPRSQRPITFMSNMLYATSLLYKSQLPFIAVFNKIDVLKHDRCLDWMQDFDAFREALKSETSYMASLSQSFALTMEEFYRGIQTVGVSAATGRGLESLVDELTGCRAEYYDVFLPFLESRRRRIFDQRAAAVREGMSKFQMDEKSSQAGAASRESKSCPQEKTKGGAPSAPKPKVLFAPTIGPPSSSGPPQVLAQTSEPDEQNTKEIRSKLQATRIGQ
eukprot:GHVT01045820.1.p1 GENE.GHVT01045820.1~~GHVT01045820.1.p1  ORF type:complete len:261 (+),score=38.82 GHVT01045820.1:59-841(+)